MTQEEGWLLEKYGGEKTDAFFIDLERLHQGEPLAFILGHIPFLNTTIYLPSRPLIPRVETEFWVSQVLEIIKSSFPEAVRILDLCAGSGCIGVAAAKALPHATVHFAEFEERHHATIQKNIAENDIEAQRTHIYGGDLFEQVPDTLFDVILCNPPYIPDGSEHVAQSVKKYEPSVALYGGADGLDLIKKIIRQAPQHLTASGMLCLEHEPEQASAIAAEAKIAHLRAQTHNDQYTVPRYTILTVAQ